MRSLVLALSTISAVALAERPSAEAANALNSLKGHASYAIPFDTFHPQGMVKVGDFFFLTSVDKVQQRGHLFKFKIEDKKIVLVGSILLNRDGQYHPGGIDFDSKTGKLVTAIAEYKKASKATLVRINPENLEIEYGQQINDHIGAIFIEKSGRILGFNWDAVDSYILSDPSQALPVVIPAESRPKNSDKAYQDVKSLGGEGAAGIASSLQGKFVKNGYLSIFSVDASGTVVEGKSIAVPRVTLPDAISTEGSAGSQSRPLTQNPMELEVLRNSTDNSEKILFYFIPHDNKSFMFVYEGTK